MASCSDWPGRFHMLTDPQLYLPAEKGSSLKVSCITSWSVEFIQTGDDDQNPLGLILRYGHKCQDTFWFVNFLISKLKDKNQVVVNIFMREKKEKH